MGKTWDRIQMTALEIFSISFLLILAAVLITDPVHAGTSSYDIYTIGFDNGRTRFASRMSLFDEVGDNSLSGEGLYSNYFARGSAGAWQPLSTDLTNDGAQEVIIANAGCYDYKYNPPAGWICEQSPTGISVIEGKTGGIIYEISSGLDGYISGYHLSDIDSNNFRELILLTNHTLYVFSWNTTTNNKFDLMNSVDFCGGDSNCLADTSIAGDNNFAEMSCVRYDTAPAGQVVCYINTAHLAHNGKFALVNISRDGNWNMRGQFVRNSSSSSLAVCNVDGDIYADIFYFSLSDNRIKGYEYNHQTDTMSTLIGNYGGVGESPSMYGGIACGSVDGDSLAEVFTPQSNGRNYAAVWEGALGGVRYYADSGYTGGETRNSYGLIDYAGQTAVCIGFAEDSHPKCFSGYGVNILNNYSVGNSNENRIFVNNNDKLCFFRTYDLGGGPTPAFTNGVAGFIAEVNPDSEIKYKFNITDTTIYSAYPQMIFADFNGDGTSDLLVSNALGAGGASRIFYSNTISTQVEINTSCTSPCVFLDNFTYSVSACNADWVGGSPQQCGYALANSSHLICSNYPYWITRSFNPLTSANGYAVVEFEYTQHDALYYPTIRAMDGDGNSVGWLEFNGPEGNIRAGTGFGSPSVVFGSLVPDESHIYQMKFDFTTKTYSVYVDGSLAVQGVGFATATSSDISSVRVVGDLIFNSCWFDLDYMMVSTQLPGEVDVIPTNQTDGQFSGISLKIGNSSFDYSKCKPNEDYNLCFGRVVAGGIGRWVAGVVLGNIVIVLIFVFILFAIGSIRR